MEREKSMKKLIFGITFLLVASSAYAQQPINVTPDNRIGWDQQAGTLTEAQNFTYRYYIDSSATGLVTTATCTSTPVANIFLCVAPPPAVSSGNHSLEITAGNIAGESAKSSPLEFAYILTPVSPSNPRVLPPG